MLIGGPEDDKLQWDHTKPLQSSFVGLTNSGKPKSLALALSWGFGVSFNDPANCAHHD